MITMDIADLKLTRRELEIWRLIAEGYAIKEIARFLFKSPKTVDWQRSSLYRKLRVTNQSQATRLAVARGVVPSEWAPVGAEVVA